MALDDKWFVIHKFPPWTCYLFMKRQTMSIQCTRLLNFANRKSANCEMWQWYDNGTTSSFCPGHSWDSEGFRHQDTFSPRNLANVAIALSMRGVRDVPTVEFIRTLDDMRRDWWEDSIRSFPWGCQLDVKGCLSLLWVETFSKRAFGGLSLDFVIQQYWMRIKLLRARAPARGDIFTLVCILVIDISFPLHISAHTPQI